MNVKPLYELNLEFQREQIAAPANCQNETAAGLTESPSTETGVKSLYDLNLEFQMQTLTDIPPETELLKNMEPEINLSDLSESSDLSELSDIFVEKPAQQKGSKKKHRGLFAVISDVLFYLALFIVMLSVITSGAKDDAPRMFMGYSYFTVLTASMQDEIPQGSLIIVRQTDSQELKIGDNITYMRDADTTVTHKITDIYDDYQNSGARGFQTKGVNNTNPDKDIVYEVNVVGKVILVLPGVGAAISSLKENIYIVFIIFGLFVALSFLIRRLFVESGKGGIEDSTKYRKKSKKTGYTSKPY